MDKKCTQNNATSPRFKDPRAVKSRRAYDKGTSTAMATPEAITFPEGVASTTTHPAKHQQHTPTTCGAATKKTTHPAKRQQHAPTTCRAATKKAVV
eukprot:scaffold184486_cov50-Attheya_sp.AAC.2